MKRASLFVACFVVLGACANDFDALSSGKAASAANEPDADPQASGGGDDDPVKTEAQDCAAKKCDVTTSNADGQLNVAAECCSYTTTCTDPNNCTTKCSNGAICEGSCQNEVACEFQVSGAKGVFACLTTSCKLECEAGSGCELDCGESDFCEATCDAKSTCVVKNCGDSCAVTCGDGSQGQVCGKGTRACGGCPS